MCDQLIKHMESGHSFESFGGVARVSRKTLFKWLEKHKDFEEARAIGYGAWCRLIENLMLSKATGVERVKGVNPKNIDATPLIFLMKTVGSKVFYERKTEENEDKPTVINLNYKV